MKSAVIIGFGSIGARHAQLLAERGVRVGAVTRNPECSYPAYAGMDAALADLRPELVVVSNETSRHIETLERLADCGYAGTVLVEKPLSDRPAPVRDWPFADIFVAYNLRFHPVIQALRRVLAAEKVISAQVHVGQYLPDWRPERDYRQSYSARRDAGGGVLRDLSHELDYALWLFGNWQRVAALGGHFSSLDIDSDDAWAILMQLERCPMLTLQMNYLDRAPRREIAVDTDSHSYRADLVSGALWRDGVEEPFACERDTTYRLQLEAVLSKDRADFCSLTEGARIVELIHCIEAAAAQGSWVKS
ncbi:MAG: Gfo/Idh/MocA family oxidoreductase [Betaproteobacteria bacterium]|nr:Gfo/Idh/MocA family oxidoreductase [Betaproteobacteria bacterium]